MRSKWTILLSMILALALLAGGCTAGTAGASTGGDTLGDGTYLLTVDGYGVTEEEFLLFLADQKAVTADYFWREYQIQPDAEFWTTAVNGETPLEHAKQRALEALVDAKITLIVAAEQEILPYQTYSQLLEAMEEENGQRARKLETGEVFYGVSQFTPFTYYRYLDNNAGAELEYAQQALCDPTEEELRQTYETYKEYFSLGTDYEYEAVYPDGRRETVTQNSLAVGKEDSTTELLLEEFAQMACGQTLRGVDFHGETADICLLSREDLGYAPMEAVTDALRELYAREAVAELLQARSETARIEVDQARFDALEMP